jgi:arsenate reductase-like glutaredoxin family protein
MNRKEEAKILGEDILKTNPDNAEIKTFLKRFSSEPAPVVSNASSTAATTTKKAR